MGRTVLFVALLPAAVVGFTVRRTTGSPLLGWIAGAAVFAAIAVFVLREISDDAPARGQVGPEPSLADIDLDRIAPRHDELPENRDL